MLNEIKSTNIIEKIKGVDGDLIDLGSSELLKIKNLLKGLILSDDTALIRRVLMDLHYDKENTALVGECIRDIVEQTTIDLDGEKVHTSLILVPIIMYTDGNGESAKIPTKLSSECVGELNHTINNPSVIPKGYNIIFGDLLFDGDSNYFSYKEALDLHGKIITGQPVNVDKEMGFEIGPSESISVLRFLIGIVTEDGNSNYEFDLIDKIGELTSDSSTREVEELNFELESILKREMDCENSLHMSIMPTDYYYQSIVSGNHYHGDCILTLLIDELNTHSSVTYTKIDILIYGSHGKIELVAHNANGVSDTSLDVARFSWPLLYRDEIRSEAEVLMEKVRQYGYEASIINVN